WKACFAFIPLNMYNEKRGFIQGKWVKYLFYAFYPVHIAILTVIRKMWFGI
ncbi:MAG: TraX family protein, partial [Blautia faecis]